MDDLTQAAGAGLTAAFERAAAASERATTMTGIEYIATTFQRAWLKAKPGAMSPTRFAEWQSRHAAVEAQIAARQSIIRAANPPPSPDFIIDRITPTPTTFFTAYRTNGPAKPDAIQAAETRVGARFPPLLRSLYEIEDDGHTNFSLGSDMVDPPYVFPNGDYHAAFKVWTGVLPGERLSPIDQVRTLGNMSDETDFCGYPSWRDLVPGIDKLVVISQHAWSLMACLDYRDRSQPGLLLFDADDPKGAQLCNHQPDFVTFFISLRREARQDDDVP